MAGAADFIAPRLLAVTVGNYLLMFHDRLLSLSLSGTTFLCMQMADLPDTLVFATLPSTQRCAGWHYRQAGSVSASTHMMPSSFSSIVLTWLLFISTIIVYKHRDATCMFAQARPPHALHSSSRLMYVHEPQTTIGASVSEPHTNAGFDVELRRTSSLKQRSIFRYFI